MSVDVDLHKVKYAKYLNELMKLEEVNDKETLEKILLKFGEKIGDYYILLNNEYYNDYNSYYNLFSLIDFYFKIDDTYPNKSSHEVFLNLCEEMVANRNRYDVAYELGIEVEW